MAARRAITRRSFLERTAAASMALAAGPAVGANERVGVGVIGCGFRGQQLTRYYAETGDFTVTHLCDCDAAMRERAANVLRRADKQPELASDFRAVLDHSDVDAVIIATPDHWHAHMAVLALEAGKHVLLEKPVSHGVQEGQAMVAAQEKYRESVVLVGTQQRSGEHFQEARAFVRGGGLGKVGFARTWFLDVRPAIEERAATEPPAHLDYEMWVGPAPYHNYREALTHFDWRWVPDYGTGELGNWGAHWLDIVRWYLDLGMPERVFGHGGSFVVKDAKRFPDTQTIIYEYPEVTVVWEHRLWSRDQPLGMRTGAQLVGDKGALFIDRQGWQFHPVAGEVERHEGSELELIHGRHFAAAIRGLTQVNSPLVSGHESAAMCHYGNLSTRLGRSIQLEGDRVVGDEEAANALRRSYREPWDGVLQPYQAPV